MKHISKNKNSKESWFSAPLDLRIYIIFAVISLIFLFYSIWEIKPVTVDLYDFLGLTSHLTTIYWIGYILIILLSIKLYLDEQIKRDFIYIIYLIVIGLFLFGVPVFAEENARFAFSYYPAGEVKQVLKSGYIDSLSTYPLISYRSWPATHIISAYMIYLGNIDFESLIKYMPLFWVVFFIIITFGTGRFLKLSLNQSFLFSFVSLSSFWQFHYYYGPQAMAYLMYLLLFMLFIRYFESVKERFVTFLIFCAIVTTHLLSSMFVLIAFFFKSIQKRFIFVLPLAIIFLAWYVYLAPYMFNVGVREFFRQANSIEMLNSLTASKYETGELFTRQITQYSRLSYLGILGIPVIIGAFRFITGKIKSNKKEIEICFYWILAISVFILLRYGRAEIEDRMYIFVIIPAVGIMILSLNRKFLVIIMLMVSLLHLPAHYGNESSDMTYQSELKGAEFFAFKSSVDKRGFFYLGNPYIQYFNFSTSKINFNWRRINNENLYEPRYIIFSKRDNNFILYRDGINAISIWFSQEKFDFIYNNGDFKILRNI